MESRVRHRSRVLWFVVRRLGKLTRSVGLRRLARTVTTHLVDGSGLEQLFIWGVDQLAYLERGNPDLYRRWVDTVEPTLTAATGGDSLGGVTVVLGAGRVLDAAETLNALDAQTHPDVRIVLSVPSSEFDRASSLVTSSKLKVVTGPQSSDDERLLLSALRAVETEYVLTLLPGAILAPNALVELHRAAIDAGADLVYADEDSLRGGVRCDPIFKPGASPDLLRVADYIGPVWLFRPASGVVDEEVVGSSVYGILVEHLRAGAVVRRVPRMLVHWDGGRDPLLSPRQIERVTPRANGDSALRFAEQPGVVASIIVPTRDRLDLLRRCISSIHRNPGELNFEVVVLDNRSEDPETRRWLSKATDEWPRLKVIDADYEFNWSKLNNQGAEAAQGKVCVFLNNDVEVISDGWLETLVGNALREEIGAVGALLLYPDDTIQHAGIVVGIGGLADHVYRGCPASAKEGFAFVSPSVTRNVLAITGACLAVERRRLSGLGGFDEKFQICGDVDLCVRLHAAGYYNLYLPEVRLYHRESATRGIEPVAAAEKSRLLERVGAEFGGEDPFYNPNLNLRSRYPSFLRPFGAIR